MKRSIPLSFVILLSVVEHSRSADFVIQSPQISQRHSMDLSVNGRVSVIDGRTIWFPEKRMLVRLADIDSCDLMQWSFDPKAAPKSSASLSPVPCGAIAKAWLNKTISNRNVRCDLVNDGLTAAQGICRIGRQDLGLEMLRVGWARLTTSIPRDRRYTRAQQAAFAARYGMWGTYVLDMEEWRDKAIDRTLGRRPQADINLLSERQSEISPPFLDARQQPRRRDR